LERDAIPHSPLGGRPFLPYHCAFLDAIYFPCYPVDASNVPGWESMSLVFFLLSCLFGVYTSGKGVSGNAKVGRLPLLKEEEEGIYELSSLEPE
jgi:hypothetical protein